MNGHFHSVSSVILFHCALLCSFYWELVNSCRPMTAIVVMFYMIFMVKFYVLTYHCRWILRRDEFSIMHFHTIFIIKAHVEK